MNLMKEQGSYIPQEFEDAIYKTWEDKGYFRAKVNNDKKPIIRNIPPINFLILIPLFLSYRSVAANKIFLGRKSFKPHRTSDVKLLC